MNQPPGRRSQAPSPGRVSNRGRRLRRWVSLSDDATSFSSEAAARKWIIDILGSRAIGLVGEGGGKGDRSGNMMSLSEALKDGRVLVRLAHAVGGRKTIGMAKVRMSSFSCALLYSFMRYLRSPKCYVRYTEGVERPTFVVDHMYCPYFSALLKENN